MSASFDCASLSGAHQPMAYCCTVQMSYVSYRLVIQWASLYLASDRRALSDYVRLLSSCCYFAARFIGSSFIFFFLLIRAARVCIMRMLCMGSIALCTIFLALAAGFLVASMRANVDQSCCALAKMVYFYLVAFFFYCFLLVSVSHTV